MNIIVSSTPKHLKVTPIMVDDFLIDPVLGVSIIFKMKLDAFQAARLRTYWWVPDVIDSSGFGTGKSLVFWLFMNLRATIIGDQWCCAYYQTFEAGKQIFWPYYNDFNPARAPIFNAQLGSIDTDGDVSGKDNKKGPACFVQNFKNGSRVLLPAPNWIQDAKSQAGLTLNVVGIDEWTKVESMTKKTNNRFTTADGAPVGGINQQILGRVRRSCFNQHHPLWGNHRLFMATAESTMHAGYARYQVFQTEIAKGNPNYATISFSFKDFSNLKSHTGKPFKEQIPDWKTIKSMKAQFTKAHFLREVLGIWARETQGLYSEAALDRCVANGMARQLEPECVRTVTDTGEMVFYFLGIDPAPALRKTADDGALAILRVKPKPGLGRAPTANVGDWLAEFVWAYRVRGDKLRSLRTATGKEDSVFIAETTREWSGHIHRKHRHFGLTGLCMDPQGGGQHIMTELNKSRQTIEGVETEVTPIASLDDLSSGVAEYILTMFRAQDPAIRALWPILTGVDNLYDAMHRAFEEAIEHGIVSFPMPFNERPASTTEGWELEKKWALKNLDAARLQLSNIQVVTRDDGTLALTRNNARQFMASGKKDLAYACIYAYIRFLAWLKMGEMDLENEAQDDGLFNATSMGRMNN
ncbi:MAG TPA: hypothetical protein VGY56_17420 [Verrucomicrobiae bacterium]|nr:hypothetical protein [Verrucomicrobiae bacterium]